MDVVFSWCPPIDKLDPQLERRFALADQLQRIDPSERQQIADVGDGRLTDTDGADLFRLDQLDLDLAEPLRKDCRSHPARGPAADDRHLSNRLFGAYQVFAPADEWLQAFTANCDGANTSANSSPVVGSSCQFVE